MLSPKPHWSDYAICNALAKYPLTGDTCDSLNWRSSDYMCQARG